MRVFDVRNVHQALPLGVRWLMQFGVERQSRNGPVRQATTPVATVYAKPLERVGIWPERDVNVAFLVYEAMWMLAGRKDLAPLTRYIKDFGRFSDDGETLHGAYGYRWRKQFGFDQLQMIASILKTNPEDRRAVLQMWDPPNDLGRISRDVPCNDTITFQRQADGSLDMTVFCRSNDIVWGTYFANAFHFATLLDYMAAWIKCPVGRYTQISVNYHGYLTTLDPLAKAFPDPLYATPLQLTNPYERDLRPVSWSGSLLQSIEDIDYEIEELLARADSPDYFHSKASLFSEAARHFDAVLRAHHVWRSQPRSKISFMSAMDALHSGTDKRVDIICAMDGWLQNKFAAWQQTKEPVDA